MYQKRNNKVLITLIILIVILILGIGIAYVCIATDMFKSDKDLFFKYAMQIADKEKGFISNEVIQYFEKKENTAYENNGTISFNITSSENQEQYDYTNKCNIEFSGKVDKASSKTERNISINYANDVKLPISYKQSGNTFGLQTKHVGGKYIAVDINELENLQYNGIKMQNVTLQSDTTKTELNDEQLKYIKDTYINVLNQELNDSNFSQVSEGNLKGYKLTINGEGFKNIVLKLLETLQNDQTTLDILNDYIKSKGLSEISVNDIEEQIEKLNKNLNMNSKQFEAIVYVENKNIKKAILSTNEAKITIEKEENANSKQYTLLCEVNQDGNVVNFYLNSEFSGLQSLQSITENHEVGIQINNVTKYTYYLNNNVDFVEATSINDFTDDNAIVLTKIDSEQANILIDAIVERMTQVNSQQMEKLGLTESENPLIKVIPLLSLYSQNQMEGYTNDVDQTVVDTHNSTFENYQSLDLKGTTVKGLLSTIQNYNSNNEEEEYKKITEINFNGEEYEPTEQNITLIKSEISLEDSYKVEFEKNSNTGMIYRAVINKN